MPDAGVEDTLELPLPNRRATRRLGRVLGAALRPGDVVLLEGSLGAGKTFLVRAVARRLGVPETAPIQSPTFALLHEHPLPGGLRLVHADLYRLSEPAEALDLDLHERDDAFLCVEWGERFRRQVERSEAAGSLLVTLERAPRSARLWGRGERGRALVAALREALATVLPPE
jgi:tRNA threonylcarbamoyl adenosine modification protein YjeE